MSDTLQKLVVLRHNDLVKIGKLQSLVDILLPMLEKDCTISHLTNKFAMTYQQLRNHLQFMTNKGWIMLQPKDDIHVQ